VKPGRTFSTRAISTVFFLNGASFRARLDTAASTCAFGPTRRLVSFRKATAVAFAPSSPKA